jgi:sugar lactone lactonase YvrE
MKIEKVGDIICTLGEGPVWNQETESIFWVDILQGNIHQYCNTTKEYKSLNTGQMVGSICLHTSHQLIAALENGFATIDLENEIITHIADPENDLTENRFNDGKCDPAGRFWAGTMNKSGGHPTGNLYMLDRDFSVRKIKSGLHVSNGLAWSVDQNTFYLIDTFQRNVLAFDYDQRTGNLTKEREIIKIPTAMGKPDGMTIDAEGMLWICLWDGWKVTRWDPATGDLLSSFELPASRVTSCTFGGKNLDDMYVTTARVGLPADELSNQPFAGSLFVIKNCGFKGLHTVSFGG